MTQQGGLHLKYRPMELDQIAGNEFLIESIKGLLNRPPEDQPRSYLLKGPSGCGKTTIARIMAREMGAVGMDLAEVDVADYRGIDTIRKLRERIQLKPIEGDVRIWVLDEVHMQTKEAQSALLKALEDTPAHVRFFLCTTDPDKLLPTIRNRCSQLAVEPLGCRDMEALLRKVAEKEEKKISRAAIEKLIDTSNGSPRAALTMLDRIIDLPRKEQAEGVIAIGESSAQIIDLCRTLIDAGPWGERVVEQIKALRKLGVDPESCRRAILGYCTTVLLSNGNGQAYLVMDSFRESTFATGWAGIAMSCWDALIRED